jgi:hypothetical protein
VLTGAAIRRAKDDLLGLKENIIMVTHGRRSCEIEEVEIGSDAGGV